ncbi:long-chain-fatty-acid--CoA ligase [Trifolium repens]|nr:long-chain-fatty-acid--CoA ligase [Trifolium repens]
MVKPKDTQTQCKLVGPFIHNIYPNNPMLGNREIVDGKLGKYKWLTYKEVYDMVIKVGNSIRSCGYGEHNGPRFSRDSGCTH